MSGPLDHKARIVAELQNRLGEATTDDDQDFLSVQLSEAGNDLEGACLIALRNVRETEALVEALKSIIADNKARKDRLEAKAEKIRAAVAQALSDAGLPKIVAPDMTVSLRQNKPTIMFACEPDVSIADQYGGFIKMKEVYSWDKEAVREWLEVGNTLSFAKLTNGSASITVRGK